MGGRAHLVVEDDRTTAELIALYLLMRNTTGGRAHRQRLPTDLLAVVRFLGSPSCFPALTVWRSAAVCARKVARR